MKALANLVMDLYRDGILDLSATDIYKAAQEIKDLKWLSHGYIEQKLNGTIKAIRKDYTNCWPMPVAQPYLDAVFTGTAEFTIQATKWIDSIHIAEHKEKGAGAEYRRAYSYLPFSSPPPEFGLPEERTTTCSSSMVTRTSTRQPRKNKPSLTILGAPPLPDLSQDTSGNS